MRDDATWCYMMSSIICYLVRCSRTLDTELVPKFRRFHRKMDFYFKLVPVLFCAFQTTWLHSFVFQLVRERVGVRHLTTKVGCNVIREVSMWQGYTEVMAMNLVKLRKPSAVQLHWPSPKMHQRATSLIGGNHSESKCKPMSRQRWNSVAPDNFRRWLDV